MKMNNEYFHKYNTRKVEFKQCSGLFLVDGVSVGRDYIEDQDNEVLSQHITYSSSLYNTSPITKPCRNSSITSKISENHHLEDVSRNNKLPINTTSAPLYEIIEEQKIFSPPNYYSRTANSKYEIIEDYHKAIRNAKVDFYKSIYHDNNHLRNHQETKLVNTTHRLWLPSVKNMKSLENTWKKEVITPIPTNKKQLGLSQLRMQGPTMQDKPHYIALSKNNLRFTTKIQSRKYTS